MNKKNNLNLPDDSSSQRDKLSCDDDSSDKKYKYLVLIASFLIVVLFSVLIFIADKKNFVTMASSLVIPLVMALLISKKINNE